MTGYAPAAWRSLPLLLLLAPAQGYTDYWTCHPTQAHLIGPAFVAPGQNFTLQAVLTIDRGLDNGCYVYGPKDCTAADSPLCWSGLEANVSSAASGARASVEVPCYIASGSRPLAPCSPLCCVSVAARVARHGGPKHAGLRCGVPPLTSPRAIHGSDGVFPDRCTAAVQASPRLTTPPSSCRRSTAKTCRCSSTATRSRGSTSRAWRLSCRTTSTPATAARARGGSSVSRSAGRCAVS